MTRLDRRNERIRPARPIGSRAGHGLGAGVLAIVVICAIAGICGSCGHHPQTRVLFIGNSFTFYNGGIGAGLTRLDPSCTTSSITVGGATLQQQWDTGRALQSIRTGHWDYVVLQEQSQTPVLDQPLFREYAARFDRAIRDSGATTVLLMTWQRPDSAAEGVTTANLAAAYRGVAAQLGARVAPAGEAFAEALLERPGLVLNNPDGHPTVEGTYLAACVVYATIVGRSPVGLVGDGLGISAALRTFLQGVAAQSLVEP